jgi:hypothetical protein
MLFNIPQELQGYPHWVVAGLSKEPLNPRTGRLASINDSSTWGTFEEAIAAKTPYIGFVLTTEDPYTIIDLDNKPDNPCTAEQWARHEKILETFISYTEKSASGTGYHIIVKGQIPAGVHRDKVEVYSSARYMICTGNVVRGAPIQDYQTLLDILFQEMRPANSAPLEDMEDVLEDQEIIEMAMGAANAEKFNALCIGDWQAMGYSSQSEADFALLSILAYYTLSNEQVRRVFRMSNLGKREKAIKNDRYLNFAIGKIRAQQPSPVDLEELKNSFATNNFTKPSLPYASPQDLHVAPGCPLLTPVDSWPVGLVGEIALHIFKTATRPVPEIAIGAAIALVAGICGRSYNVSGTGLNQYIILLAKTGAGKEGAATGIEELIAAIRPAVPMVDQFMGPSAFASGQALVKVLNDRPCFVSILGEFGLTLQQLCDPRANGPQIMLKKVLLDLYSKSGWNKVLRSSVYSDAEKNTKIVQAPNVTILGESTPESFFNGLDNVHIAEGLIPRFSIIEYNGPRPKRNRNTAIPPSPELINKLSSLVVIALTTSNNRTCVEVTLDEAAIYHLDNFDTTADLAINQAGADVDMQLWNRAHLKALKLAGVLAVGCNPHSPVITGDIAQWAIAFVEKDIAVMATRFKHGEVGNGDHRHESDIRRAIENYLEMNDSQRLQYKTPKSLLNLPVVPFHYLRRKVRLLAAFKNDRRGIARALEESLKDMVKAEILQLIPQQQALTEFACKSELYVKGPTW